ncbi:hypothetical protein [Streptomyces sp. NRRL S-448]|uniref:hypothetical protein n=1 Tax=Streptomyces sp. NRRL S-448 TaxID=1463907 RepID=UPI003568D62D
MSRIAAPRRARTAVLAGVAVLAAAAAVHGVTPHAEASPAPQGPATRAAAGTAPVVAESSPSAAPVVDTRSARPGSTVPKKTDGATVTAKTAPRSTVKAANAAKDVKDVKDVKAGAAKAPAAVQVTPAQLPDNARLKWKPLAPAVTQPLTADFQLNECASVPGATTWRQEAFISKDKTPAAHNTLTFKDEAAAKAGLRKVLEGMSSCAATSQALQKEYGLTPDATVAQTAGSDSGRAWSRRWNGVMGSSAAGFQTNHVYAVQRGAVLTLLTFEEWDSAAPASYDTRSDASVLATLGR